MRRELGLVWSPGEGPGLETGVLECWSEDRPEGPVKRLTGV